MAGLSQTGQFHVGFFSFICRYRFASKHCRCRQVDARHGVDMRIFPSGHISDTFSIVVAISLSASFSFSSINAFVKLVALIPFDLSRLSSSAEFCFRTKYTDTQKLRPYSKHHDTWMLFGTVGDSFTSGVMLTGLGGRFGSVFGLLVGMGFYKTE